MLVELNQRLQRDIRYLIRLEPGVQTPEETLTLGIGLVPRLDVAARAAAAPPRAGGAVRLRLPDPARRRTSSRSTVRSAPTQRLHRSPRLVRGVPAGRRLDGPRSDVGPAGRRRAPAARLHARAVECRAGHAAASTSARSSSSTRCRCSASHESPRVTKPYTDDAVAGDRRRSAAPSTRPRSAATCG